MKSPVWVCCFEISYVAGDRVFIKKTQGSRKIQSIFSSKDVNSEDNQIFEHGNVMKAGLLLIFLFIATPVFAGEIETVLMVSIDALHPAALSQKTSPALDRLMQSGRYCRRRLNIEPPCRSNIEPGRVASFWSGNCG